jgi:hypothetical protein
MADECLVHGPLDDFSAFAFETFLGTLKSFIRTPYNPLAQLVNRIHEMNRIQDSRQSPPVTTNVNGILNQHLELSNSYHGVKYKISNI